MKPNFKTIEKKWQEKWEKEKVFKIKPGTEKKKFYCLEMYPYPSSEGLHIGHGLNYTIGDIQARFKRMSGFNVLYPMGYDSFGLPAENAAIKVGIHPKKHTEKAINNYIKQQKALGLSYDWSHLLMSHDTNYYKWNQLFFLEFFEKGLAYRKKAPVNWCPKCNTVLANEQVHNGRCEYHTDTDVEVKHLEQWFIKTTDYADELLEQIDDLDWPQRIKTMQKNWIGKSYGTEIDFEIERTSSQYTKIYFASRNKSKLKRLKKIFFQIDSSLKIEPVPKLIEVEENGKDVLENSFQKVLPYKNKYNYPVIAGDTAVFFDGEEFNPTHVKRICLGKGDESKLSQKEIAEKMKDFYIRLAKKYGGKKEFYYEDGWTILFPDGTTKQTKYKREYILTDRLQGKLDIHFPMRCLYLVKATNKNIFEQTEEDYFKEFAPQINSFKNFFNREIKKFPVFTTRPDTIYGVTFMVISAQHPRLMELVTKENKKDVEKFLKKIKSVSEKEMKELEKEGVFTGSYAINPLTREKIPVYAGNFVVADYGSGMVMAVPAHDQRDLEFAKKYKINIQSVIVPKDDPTSNVNLIETLGRAYTSDGVLINSSQFNNMNNREAIEEITKFLQKKKLGRKAIQYKLRDWLISRQRYWGTPIPVIYCDKCGVVPVVEKNLPVKLPEKVNFGKGNPLETNKNFVNTICPKCKGKARRETDTMDTFVDSSWYYMRYPDNKNKKAPFDKKIEKYWLPVNLYIGGAEHATMHLLYARFWTKALRDLGYVEYDEPFKKLFNQGMLHASDGRKMSKSLGNVINPLDIIKKQGADALRLTLMSFALPDSDTNWDDKVLQGSSKFLMKVYDRIDNIKISKADARTESKLNRTIKEITNYIENFKYNLAVIEIRGFFNSLPEETSKKVLETFLKLLHPFCPHITEELWFKIRGRGFISLAQWPEVDEKKIDRRFEMEDEIIEKTNNDIIHIKEISGINNPHTFIYPVPAEAKLFEEKKEYLLAVSGSAILDVHSAKDVKTNPSLDPKGKSKKAKPGKPGIYIEPAGTFYEI